MEATAVRASHAYTRTGSLMDLKSYPDWLQNVIGECSDARERATRHELFCQMKEGTISPAAARHFLVGFWPVVQQFPQYMALNLLKVQFGHSPGHELARRYLIQNIRVEQHHADYWVQWAEASAIDRDDLLAGTGSAAAEALSHWCWHTCERDPLATAMAATNYAIEGATGDWTAFVCSATEYEEGFPLEVRKQAMRWLKVHAKYDDEHPWLALEIIATLMGVAPSARDILRVQHCIRTSYDYMCMTLDDCLTVAAAPRHAVSFEAVRAA